MSLCAENAVLSADASAQSTLINSGRIPVICSIPSMLVIVELDKLSIITTLKPAFCNATVVCEPI